MSLQMTDVNPLLVEYAALRKDIRTLERTLSSKRGMLAGLSQYLYAAGHDPDKFFDANSNQENLPIPEGDGVSPGSSMLAAVRECAKQVGGDFGIEEIFPKIKAHFKKAERKDVSYALWILAKSGEMKNLVKGRRGTPARYTLS